jgi:hypothetical protein
MKKDTLLFIEKNLWFSILFFCLAPLSGYSEATVPYIIVNSSPDFSDDEIYVGLVGQTNAAISTGVWIDIGENGINAPAEKIIDTTWNTVHKVTGDWGYASMFTKLSDIKNHTVYVPKIVGCRMLFSFRKPLYIHFFATGGYAGADFQNPTDPNVGIRWELIELAWADNGMWVNTSRVDAYQYPMGLELWGGPGANNSYMKTGELLSHKEIINRFKATFPSGDFKPCYETDAFASDSLGGIIVQPSKLAQFQDSGVSAAYFQNYIDRIWNYYSTNELVVSLGVTGEYRGSVDSGALKMVGPGGVAAWISAKPNTQEVIEAKGVLAEDVTATPDINADKAFQAIFCAAVNRGVIDLTVPGGQPQYWDSVSEYFTIDTYNKYVWFWHQPDISYNSKSYAFAYDDVNEQSSTLQTTIPDSVKITIGGFAASVRTMHPLHNPPMHNLDILSLAAAKQLDLTLYSAQGVKLAIIKPGANMLREVAMIESMLHAGFYIMRIEDHGMRLCSKRVIVR